MSGDSLRPCSVRATSWAARQPLPRPPVSHGQAPGQGHAAASASPASRVGVAEEVDEFGSLAPGRGSTPGRRVPRDEFSSSRPPLRPIRVIWLRCSHVTQPSASWSLPSPAGRRARAFPARIGCTAFSTAPAGNPALTGARRTSRPPGRSEVTADYGLTRATQSSMALIEQPNLVVVGDQ